MLDQPQTSGGSPDVTDPPAVRPPTVPHRILDLIARGADDGYLGRFVLTCACAYVFAWLACNGKISAETAVGMTGTVFGFYYGAQARRSEP
jgi:hypothetical protein